jgi:hypothetical protein
MLSQRGGKNETGSKSVVGDAQQTVARATSEQWVWCSVPLHHLPIHVDHRLLSFIPLIHSSMRCDSTYKCKSNVSWMDRIGFIYSTERGYEITGTKLD